MSFRIFLFLALERNHLCNFGRRHYGEHLSDFFSPEPVVQEMLFINVSIFSSGGHCLHWAELFTRFLWRELWGHSGEIIFNLDRWFRGRCHLNEKFTHEGYRTKTKHNSSTMSLWFRWPKKCPTLL